MTVSGVCLSPSPGTSDPEVLGHRDHGALDARDAGFIDGLGLALLHVAARWKEHPAFQAAWAPPRVEARHLLDGDYT